MPLPFIFAAAAAGYGIKKSLDAKDDFYRAKSINEKAQKKYDKASSKLEKSRNKAQKSMEKLGALKFSLYEGSMIPFVEALSRIKNIDFDNNMLLDTANILATTKDEFGEIKKTVIDMQDVVRGGVAAIGSGGLAGLAAYGGVGLLGTASTGTGIAGLGGVAYTNATLAWLGGGSLAAGGFGMAGGVVVLGGIVTAPVLAIGGKMLSSKAEAAKEDAYANLSKAELAAEEMKSASLATKGIQTRFQEIHNVLVALNEKFTPLSDEMQKLVMNHTDYQSYSEDDRKGVFMTVSLAKTIKNIMETPLIDEKGLVTSESRKALSNADKILEHLN